MISDQLVAGLLLGLVPQALASMANLAHSSVQDIGVAVDLTPAVGRGPVQYSSANIQANELQETAQRFKVQSDKTPPVDTPRAPFTFESPEDKEETQSNAEKRFLFAGGGHASSGAHPAGGGRGAAFAGHVPYAGVGGANNNGKHHNAANQSLFSYLLSFFGLGAYLAFRREV